MTENSSRYSYPKWVYFEYPVNLIVEGKKRKHLVVFATDEKDARREIRECGEWQKLKDENGDLLNEKLFKFVNTKELDEV